MGWIDTIVVTIVILIGLFIMYRALKEPIDLMFYWLGRGLGGIRNKVADIGSGGEYEVIRYG
jgi:hypothetical protein